MFLFLLLSSCGEEIEQSPADPPEPTTATDVSETFVDVAESAGLTFVHFNGMSGEHYFNEMMGGGAALLDYDNDGDLDVYVTNFGSNRLLRNRDDGTSEDVTAATGTDDPRWSVAATFFDFDRDGWLDLYVGNSVDFTLASHTVCQNPGGPQTFGSLIQPHPHLHALASRGLWDKQGQWLPVPYVDTIAAEKLFAHKISYLLKSKGLLSDGIVYLVRSSRVSFCAVKTLHDQQTLNIGKRSWPPAPQQNPGPASKTPT